MADYVKNVQRRMNAAMKCFCRLQILQEQVSVRTQEKRKKNDLYRNP